ncbi:MAG: imidazole glycerol phosphate synthase subunit HisH [Clostridia bacterium]|nr:imidazole glycerol phosphate synthase subunit HisH [Clostridia bacterium]
MIAIIDYGVGNLFSLRCSLERVGADVIVTSDPEALRRADKLLLPGVGAFEDAMKKLRVNGLDQVVMKEAQNGKPLLGICLGMQILFEKSYEYGEHQGLGLLKGSVIGMDGTIPSGLQIPHIGWNALHIQQPDCSLFRYIQNNDCVYFVHSYYAVGCEDSLAASAEYGTEITAAVAKGNIFGCQFHPEKSGTVGLGILKAFCELEV